MYTVQNCLAIESVLSKLLAHSRQYTPSNDCSDGSHAATTVSFHMQPSSANNLLSKQHEAIPLVGSTHCSSFGLPNVYMLLS